MCSRVRLRGRAQPRTQQALTEVYAHDRIFSTGAKDRLPHYIGLENSGVVSPEGQIPLPPQYQTPSAAPTAAAAPPREAGPVNPHVVSSLPPGISGTTPHTPSPFDSDPGYQAAVTAEQAGNATLASQLQNLITQRIVAYGDPSLAGQAGFGLDPQAAAFAQQNYLSGNGEKARIDKAHDNARQAIINQLAAHGIVFSGDTGYQIGNADQTYGNQVYDAQQSALADILGYRTGSQTQQSALHQATIAALENAYNNYVANPTAYVAPPQVPAAAASQPVAQAPPPPQSVQSIIDQLRWQR